MYWMNESVKVGNMRQLQFYMDGDADVNNLPTLIASGVKQGDDDVSCLPCGKGSLAISFQSGKIYALNSSNQWVAVGDGTVPYTPTPYASLLSVPPSDMSVVDDLKVGDYQQGVTISDGVISGMILNVANAIPK